MAQREYICISHSVRKIFMQRMVCSLTLMIRMFSWHNRNIPMFYMIKNLNPIFCWPKNFFVHACTLSLCRHFYHNLSLKYLCVNLRLALNTRSATIKQHIEFGSVVERKSVECECSFFSSRVFRYSVYDLFPFLPYFHSMPYVISALFGGFALSI